MTEKTFRRIALGMKDAVEGAHMGHPDFRVGGRIFATLRGDGKRGMVKLRPDQQEAFVARDPDAFAPENGAWGRQGCTSVRLEAVEEEVLGEAMTLAWKEGVEKGSTPRKQRARKKGGNALPNLKRAKRP